MKLRNKKTGEVVETGDNYLHLQGKYLYSSLAEVNEEWEDYEEPKDSWAISPFGGVYSLNAMFALKREQDIRERKEKLKEIGNYFETEEEAEKAVEKLKAWKRLKDKGFRFDGYDSYFEGHWAIFPNDTEGSWCLAEDKADLDLLFGGEDE